MIKVSTNYSKMKYLFSKLRWWRGHEELSLTLRFCRNESFENDADLLPDTVKPE